LRGRLILILVLVVLAAVFVISRFGIDRGAQDKSLYPRFKAERAARIQVKGKSSQATLDKVDGVWIVSSEDSFPAEAIAVEDSFPAEAMAVDNMFDRVAGFSRKDIVSSNPEKQSIYQVDSTGIQVAIEDASGEDVASFIIGKVGPDYQSTYVRDIKSNDVVLSSGYLPPIFDRGDRTWQERTIFTYEPSDLLEMVLTRPSGLITVSRGEGGAWYISKPESMACDQGRATRLARTLAYLKGDGIAGRAPVAGSGLAEADSSVWFKTTDGTEEHLRFGNRSESGQTYVLREGSEMVIKLVPTRVATMLPGLEELKPQAPEGTPPRTRPQAMPPPASAPTGSEPSAPPGGE